MTQAQLAVCIPVFRPDLGQLARLLASAAAAGPSVEIVISEDASSEPPLSASAPGLLQEFGVEYSLASRRLGMVGNWNRAIAMSHAEVVVLPGQDDLFAPEFAEAHLAGHRRQAGGDVVALRQQYIDDAGRRRPSPRRSVDPELIFRPGTCYSLPSSTAVDLALAYGNVYGDPVSVSFSRSAFGSLGGFDERFRHAADLEFWLRLSVNGGSLFLSDRPGGLRRIHDANATDLHKADGSTSADRRRLFDTYRELASPWALRRGAARLLVHECFDALSHRRRPRRSNLAAWGSVRGLLGECREQFGNTAPRGGALAGAHAVDCR